tara:strand:+ start:298 stop:531 length:234 start_codon:yes stop_codon:yes gene_type:complete
MKAGDLVRYYKDTIVSDDGDTYFYKKTEVALVVEDYNPSIKLIKIYTDGEIKVVHISDVNTLKRGAAWTKTITDQCK